MDALDQLTFRAFRGREDYAGIAALINERVADIGEGEHATVESVSEVYDHLQRCNPDTDIRMVDGPDGRLVAYTRVAWHDIKEGYRAYGIVFAASTEFDGLADRILGWGLDRAMAIASGHEHPDRRIITFAVGGTESEAAIRRAGGFEPFTWYAVMVRPNLGGIPPCPLPAGLHIRPVGAADLRSIWEADGDAFRDYPGTTEPDETDWESFREGAERGTELWQVAWDDDGRVIGQVRTRVNDGEADVLGRRRAWTEDIATHREWRGRGVASALIAASLCQLAELGFDEAALDVDLDNPNGALCLYERLGYKVALRQTQYARRL